MITVTVETIDLVAVTGTQYRQIDAAMLARPLEPSTAGDTASKCKIWISLQQGDQSVVQQWLVTETYAAVETALDDDGVVAGVELTSHKDATGGYAGLTLFKINFKNVANTFTSFFTNAATAARTYTFPDETGTVITNQSKDATGGYAGLTLFKVNLKNDADTFTSTLANTNSAARAYTLPDVAGGILVGAKIATGALVAGVRTVTVTGASTGSTAVVMTVALGGTVAAGGYKVACTANTVTITALQVDGTTTETSCTSTVQGICIL